MIRVVLAEDLEMVRGALVALLQLEPDIDVVAQIGSGDLVLATVREHRPDVAVLDIDMPGIDGISAAAELLEFVPSCRVLMLTSLSGPANLRKALAVRVAGFLLKDAPPDELAAAIRGVAEGRRIIDPSLVLDAWDTTASPLTARETEVLALAADGADAAEIASRLYLSVGTVRNYLTVTVAKLQARNRIDAIRIARSSGWV